MVHGGILARAIAPTISTRPSRHGITLIDLVVVNLYPFVKAAQNPETLVRRADRGDRHRRPEPRPRRGQELRGRARRRVAVRLRTRARRSSIAQADRRASSASSWRAKRSRTPAPTTRRSRPTLEHGQRQTMPGSRAWRRAGFPTVHDARPAEGARSSLRREPASARGAGTPRIRPLDPGVRRSCRARSCRTPTCSISMPRCASCSSSTSRRRRVIKHTNPCGAATGSSAADAYVRARDADPLSAFGGIVGLNRPIDVETARADRVDAHRRGHCARRSTTRRARFWRPRPTCASSSPTCRDPLASVAEDLRDSLDCSAACSCRVATRVDRGAASRGRPTICRS